MAPAALGLPKAKIIVFPKTMFSKRGEQVDAFELFRRTVAQVHEFELLGR